MVELTLADLSPQPKIYSSSRELWDVLVGEDLCRPVMEASLSGDQSALQTLLSQPHWIKTMFEEQHTIYSMCGPSPGRAMDDERRVQAMPLSNIERAIIIAAGAGHATVVSTLLSFVGPHGEDPVSAISRDAIMKAIRNNDAAVMESLAQADPRGLTFDLWHGMLPLYEAVKCRDRPEVVAVLLRLGADPIKPVGRDGNLYRHHKALLRNAAMSRTPRTVELLLEHGVPIAGSGALHTAVSMGHFDTARLLIDHGADLNEKVGKGWTPMHRAAWSGRVDAMEFLETSGAQADAKDEDGRTPQELLEQIKREKQLAWTR